MKHFYTQRLRRHLKKMIKYTSYILNDHFVLVCLFLLGGFGFYYSDFLKSVTPPFVAGKWILLAFWLVILWFGRLATLTEEADQVFLLPKESAMHTYLWHALSYSFGVSALVLLALLGISMPLVVVATKGSFLHFFLYAGILLGLKGGHFCLQVYQLYGSPRLFQLYQVLWLGISLGMCLLALYVQAWLALCGSLAFLVGMIFFVKRQMQRLPLKWEKMIQKEKQRMYRVYQFIHLFTDVPEIQTTVKRRKYLDPFLRPIRRSSQNTYLYLYARRLLRGSEYSGLCLRLILIGCVLLFFLDAFWFSLGVALFFVYLIGFQMIPLYTQFDYILMTQLYPLSLNEKTKSLQSLLGGLLGVTACLFSGMALFALPNIVESFWLLLALVAEIFLLLFFYVPYRIRKMQVLLRT